MSKPLRPYQEQSLCNIEDDLKNGNDKLLLVLATGLGKTKVAVDLTERLKAKRVLFIADTEELIEQSALAFLENKFNQEFADHVEAIGFVNWANGAKCNFKNVDNEFRMGVIKADAFQINATVVVASAQTLYRRLDKIPVDYFDLIIVDECHKYMSKTYIQPLNYFTPKLMVGLSATPFRMDGLSLGNLFQKITFEYNISDGIKNNYLCQLDGIRIKTDVSLDNVKTTAGELNTRELATEVNIPRRNRLVVDSYIKHAIGKQGIFFCVDVQHAIDLAEMFNEYGISCKPVVGDEKVTPERKKTIREFKDGKIQVLTNVMVLTTGFNHPEVGCIGNVAPTKSLVKFIQSVGRGTRLKSKEYVDKYGQVCTILDFVDSTSRHKLINCWELDRVLNLEDRVFTTPEKKQQILEERQRRVAHVENLYKKDEKISLIELPPAKQFAWKKMQEQATTPQLKWITDLGYDTTNVQYTKQQCADIISMESCSKREKDYLESKGYDATFATKGQYSTVYYEFEMKNKWKKR
jgi:superfamily II DNA or RNA helicase